MARRRARFQLIAAQCRRCGCALLTGNRSLYGADAIKARWDRICERCMTDAERETMLREQAAGVLAYLAPR